jgi:hypothetical protein
MGVASRGGLSEQVPVFVNDALRREAPRSVKSVQEGRKNRPDSGGGSVMCIEKRFRWNSDNSDKIALLKRHRMLLHSDFVPCGCAEITLHRQSEIFVRRPCIPRGVTALRACRRRCRRQPAVTAALNLLGAP